MSYEWKQLEQSAQSPKYIASNTELAERCRDWQSLPLIAIDTEFQRVDTFYPIPGLVQVADDQACYLIDPISITDLSPLAELFTNEAVLKVVHAGSEDLELFQRMLNCLPKPIFDTQLAAAFAGWGFMMGLQRIVDRTLGVELGKGETTSNWLQRPLSDKQKVYAALDVAYLPAICQQLTQDLQQLDRLDWFREESNYTLEQAVDTDPEGAAYYRRFSQMWGLPEYKLAALRDLTCWRELESRKRDVPRGRVLKNQTILSIINTWPASAFELSKAEDIRHKTIKQEGELILALLKSAKASAAKTRVLPIQKPLAVIWNKRLKKLKALARKAANEMNICPEILLKKKDLEVLVRSSDEQGQYVLPPELNGWRKAIIGDALLAMLQNFELSEE